MISQILVASFKIKTKVELKIHVKYAAYQVSSTHYSPIKQSVKSPIFM